LLEKQWFCGEVASFCEGFDVRIYRRAVVVAFVEVLGSVRVSNRLIAGSIVAGGGFVRRTLVCRVFMRKMRSNRSSPIVPVATEGAMTMAQMVEIMRALQANVEASRIEQAKMHEDLVASRARNEELSKMTEELRQALQEQRGRPVTEEVAPSSPPRVFPIPFAQAITDTPIPASVVPMKATFTGVEDPEAHLTMFHTQMMLSGGSDVVYCKMFVSTL